jgi:pheromone shutdown-related protein TraB
LPDVLPNGVSVFRLGDRAFYLIGTAHVSQRSVEEVSSLIEAVRPDVVCVELCDRRYRQLAASNTAGPPPFSWRRVLFSGRPFFHVAEAMLFGFYRMIGTRAQVEPGAEMRAAIRSAQQIGARVVPIDRPVEGTLNSCWKSLPFRKKILLLFEFLWYATGIPTISASTIEEIREPERVAELVDALSRSCPELKRRLIDERDVYMADALRGVFGSRIVVVVGAGHLPGISGILGGFREGFGCNGETEVVSLPEL